MARSGLTLLAAASVLALSACGPSAIEKKAAQQAAEKKEQAKTGLQVSSAQSIQLNGPASAAALVANATIPWQGRIIVAPKSGGLDIYSVEGVAGEHQDGGTYKQLVASPGFLLRTLRMAMILAVGEDGSLQPKLVDDARGGIHDLPVQGLPATGVRAVCTLPGNPIAPKFALFRDDNHVDIYQIKDDGSAQLVANKLKSAELPVTMQSCASVGNKLFASGAQRGLYEIDISGDTPSVARGVDTPSGKLVGMTTSDNDGYLLLRQDKDHLIWQFDISDLQPKKMWSAVQSLSLPPVAQAGDMDTSARNFGGASFHYGLLAVQDEANHRIALIARETLPGLKPPAAKPASNGMSLDKPQIKSELPNKVK